MGLPQRLNRLGLRDGFGLAMLPACHREGFVMIAPVRFGILGAANIARQFTGKRCHER